MSANIVVNGIGIIGKRVAHAIPFTTILADIFTSL
jgi:glyceraldehyde-3-phosphate dehydrogenase/erythrose-4-phosphate dehydrogenase